jgi:acyl phosphate:glycerol-3-phosphate acyltransferase
LSAGLWLATAFTFRFSSLGALVASALAPVLAYFFHLSPIAVIAILCMSMMVWFRHRENISRLINGQEPKIGGAKS